MAQVRDGRSWVEALPARMFFTVHDVPGSARSAESLLSRLASDDGPIQRVKPGLYWKRPPPTRFGVARPDPVEAAVVAGGPGSGPTGWLATNLLGLSTQVPAIPSIAVVSRPPKGIRGVQFTARSNRRRVELSPMEVAVLEALRDYPSYTELPWPEVAARIRRLASEGRIDLARLASVAAGERRPGLRARLGEVEAGDRSL